MGSEGKVRLRAGEIDEVLVKGSRWAVARGYGRPEDLETTEERGEMAGTDPERVSGRAKERGIPQLGTLGSGNHFLEVAVVDEIYEPDIASVMGIDQVGQVMLLIHCGSRGLGHQVADDYIKEMVRAMQKYGIEVPDRQLACTPVKSPEGQAYLSAMRCAANYAWANRQCITHWVRESFSQVLGKSEEDAGLELIYDVTHNIAKIEEHEVDGQQAEALCAPQGCHPGLPGRPPRYTAAICIGGAARPHPRGYGASLLRAGGDRAGDEGDLWLHLPRRRPDAEPRRSQEACQRERRSIGAGSPRHNRQGGQSLRSG